MKKNRTCFYLFLLLAIFQLAVPLYMMWHWEDVLQNGRQYTWITAPVDPYDALKGRYVDLYFKEMKGPIEDGAVLMPGERAYAMLAEDEKGYAFITKVSSVQPKEDSYIRIKVLYIENNTAHFMLPFKRYYMQENLAPAAESAYRKSAGKECIAKVRIKDGYGVMEELYIGDKKIYDYLREKE